NLDLRPVASAARALYQTSGDRAARPVHSVHAFHLACCRIDPCPAAAGGLDRGAGPGRTLADPADAALSEPARRPCDRAGVRPGIPGRYLARSAAGVLRSEEHTSELQSR